MNGQKEKRFLAELEALFVGADVEGESGFVNLMRMKRGYFQSIQPTLMANIDSRAKQDTNFREELFDKLYTFFHRYFCESGSIYFRHLPVFAKTYEQVYADGQDAALNWKTQMLYYVKSDVLVRSMPVELNEAGKPQKTRRFYFDASEFEHKQNNERREFVFNLVELKREKEGLVIHLKVSYARGGTKTKNDAILKAARKKGISLSEEELQKAIGVFRRQTEVDFFINKDARRFLREQFDLWLYQYMFHEETIFEQKRLTQLQAIRDTAYEIIDFIAQFEDELRRVWEKPKFVRGVNYVVTLDKLTDKTLKKIVKHKGAKAQLAEWRKFGMVDNEFSMRTIFNGQKSLDDANGASDEWRFLPLDTKHFKDLELEILAGLGNLDEALDGELVHSENWQALNTLQRRYKGQVKCIHIDPPYNTKTSGFLYRNEYRHSSWLTMMDNRIDCSLGMLSENGSFLCHIDENEYERLHLLFDSGETENAGCIVWDKRNPVGGGGGIAMQHEYILCRVKRQLDLTRKRKNAPAILKKAKVLIRQHGGVTEDVREEFKAWVRTQESFSVNEKTYCEIDDNGRVFSSVHMGAPETRTDLKFHKLIIHPVTQKPCPVPESGWSMTPEFIAELIKKGDVVFGKDETIQPRQKYYLEERTREPMSSIIPFGKKGKGIMKKMGLQFPYCHHPELYQMLLSMFAMKPGEIVTDFFAGSGTTAHAVINLNRQDNGKRKYVLIEMGEYFHTVLLPRIKKVVFSKDWRDGKPVSGDGISHFLKYYTLEQYEETLKNSRYQDGEQLELDSTKSPFEQYVFFGDDKLARVVKPQKNGKLKINLRNLYPDIDIAESLANILGKQIRTRTADSVTFADGSTEKTAPAKMTETEKMHFISLIKPYLWWGE